MGIKDLNKVLADEAPHARSVLPLSILSGRTVAIDATNFVYITWMTANKSVVNSTDVTTSDLERQRILRSWFNNLWSFLRRFLSKMITPVFVFDGVYPHDKTETQQKRREERMKAHSQVLDLKERLAKMDPLAIDRELVSKLRLLMVRDTFIAGDEIDIFQEVLKSIGIPVLQAPGEAEKFCAMLVLEGLASAVFSTDTDTLVYGCPLLITGFTRSKSDMMEVTRLDKALEGLKFTFSQFQELCFMLGCDYNKRIYGIGPKKAVAHLRKYGSLANFPASMDQSCLRLSEVRTLFSREPTNLSLAQVSVNLQMLQTALPVLEALGIIDWLEELPKYYSNWKSNLTSPIVYPVEVHPIIKPAAINKQVLQQITREPEK